MMMDRLNGIETALKIRKVDQNVAILIVTATVEYAIEGYKINAASHCQTGIKAEISENYKKPIRLHDKKRGLITIFPARGTTVISMEDIFYFESDIRFHLTFLQTGRLYLLPDGSAPSRSRRKAMAFSGSIRALS